MWMPSTRAQIGGLRWTIHPQSSSDFPGLVEILTKPDEGLEENKKIIFGNKSDIAYHKRLVVKRYNSRKPSDALLDLMRPSKAIFAFRKARLLEEIGIPVARCLAAAYGSRHGIYWPSYLVMERVCGANNYRPFFKAGGDIQRAKDLGRMIGRLHFNGLRHRDMRCENLLEDDQGGLRFIDMEGIRIQIFSKTTRVLRDLKILYGNFNQLGSRPRKYVIATFWRSYLREQGPSKYRNFSKARKQIFGKEINSRLQF
jgi:tRNA A-37 threonylcarbamoyl transferase component Bud32